MPLQPGDKLGPYEVLAPIGAGGMGEVYKARDTRLDRIVAIKVSKIEFSQRFEREAGAAAALNHSNICQLYDVGPNYLVMEFVDGAPIAAPDSPRKLLDFAVQIAEGMAAAHAARLVHRDLKPDNILVTGAHSAHPGRVKILDFGLAKTGAEASVEENATRTIGLTDAGTTVGTVAYMSPEQARGLTNLTAQSDQFSFGLVLYELAAGKRAFTRASAAETMTAIIREEAEPLPASVPTALRWVIERLLAKEPAERYDSTRDLYRELKQIRERYSEATGVQPIPGPEIARAPAPLQRRFGKLPWIAAGVMTAAAIGLFILYSHASATAGPPANAVPVIVLMDTSAPAGVYDAATREKSGTNADDISDALRDLPVALHKETISATWNREDQVLKQNPDLIVIHRSAFVHAMVLDFELGYPAPGGSSGSRAADASQRPSRDILYERLDALGEDKLDAFLGYIAAANPRTRFLVYSRGWFQQPETLAKWTRSIQRRFPAMNGRMFTMPVTNKNMIASFRDPATVAQLTQSVRSILGLQISGAKR